MAKRKIKTKTVRCRFTTVSLTKVGVEFSRGLMEDELAIDLLADATLECIIKLDGADADGQLDLNGDLVKNGLDIVGDSKNIVFNKASIKFGVSIDPEDVDANDLKHFMRKSGSIKFTKIGASGLNKKDEVDEDDGDE